MSGLAESVYNKLLHDISRVAKGLGILKTRTDTEANALLYSLLYDELKKITEDVDDIVELGQINKYDHDKLCSDVTRITQGFEALKSNDLKKIRELLFILMENEVTKIHADLEEMKGANGNGKTC